LSGSNFSNTSLGTPALISRPKAPSRQGLSPASSITQKAIFLAELRHLEDSVALKLRIHFALQPPPEYGQALGDISGAERTPTPPIRACIKRSYKTASAGIRTQVSQSDR
jgi:hypothetical protein